MTALSSIPTVKAASRLAPLRLPAMTVAVAQAVNNHMSAVLADEANFDDAGKALDEKEAARTLEVEFACFEAFCATPCLTPSDVQAKIAYVLNGTQGERTPLSEYLYVYDGGEPLAKFLQSLVLGS